MSTGSNRQRALTPSNAAALSKRPVKPLRINLRFLWIPFLALVVEILRSQNFEYLHPFEMGLGIAIALLAFLPGIVWTSQSVRELPAFQCFCAIHYPYYAYPVITASSAYLRSNTSARLEACSTVVVCLLTAIIVYYAHRSKDFFTRPTTLIQVREVPEQTMIKLAMVMLLVGTFYTIGMNFGFLRPIFTGSLRNVGHIVGTASATLGIWVLARLLGAGRMSFGNTLVFLTVFGILLIVSAGTALLAMATMSLIVFIVAFMMGSSRIPWGMIIASVAVLSFLSFGKGLARQKSWIGGQAPILTLGSMATTYATWVESSLQVMMTGDDRTKAEASVFSRANLIHVQTRAVSIVPAQKPFLFGKTYEYIPEMLVPRLLWKDKPGVHTANNIISQYCDVSSHRGNATTTIGMGLLGEAWVNFGWAGVVGLGVVIGAAMRFMASACTAVGPTTLHSLASVIWIGSSIQIEGATSGWLSSFSQSMIVLLVMMYPFSRPVREPKPQTAGAEGALASSAPSG